MKLDTINYSIGNRATLDLAATQQNSIIVFLNDGRVQLKHGAPTGVTCGQVISLPHGTSMSILNPGVAPVRLVLIHVHE